MQNLKYRNIDYRGVIFAFVFAVIFIAPNAACAGKRPEKISSPPTSSKSSLEDIADGLADFEKRASNYSKDEWNFVLGYANYRRGNFKDAEEYLAKAADNFPQISDHILFYRAVSVNRLGQHSDALSFLDTLKSATPDSVWMTESMIERSRALIGLSRFVESRKFLNDYKKSVDGEKSFDADILIANSYIKENDENNAVNFVRTLAISSDSEAKIKELSGLMDEVKRKFHVDIRDWLDEPLNQYRLARSFSERSQWDEAAARLEKLIKGQDLNGSALTQARWLLARSYRSIHNYDDAIEIMEGLLKDANAAGFRQDLLSTLATTYTKKNEYEKAIAIRRQMMESVPASSPFAAKMAGKIAFLYMDEGKYDEAIGAWRRALLMRGAAGQTAKWYLAWSYHMNGDDSNAAAILGEMLKTSGKKSAMRDRLLYWKARFGEKENSVIARGLYSQVIDEYPNGYYAELSERRLSKDARGTKAFALDKRGVIPAKAGIPMSQWDPAVPSASSGHSKPRDDEQGPRDDSLYKFPHAARALFFDKLGLHEEVAREIRAAGLSGMGRADAFLKLASRNFAHDAAYRFAEGAYHNQLKSGSPDASGLNPMIWKAAFPRAHNPLVMQLTNESPVDPMLVWSIMRNESAFRPEVVSPAGAVGLMQLMPATATRLSRDAGGGSVDRRDLYRPSANITWGVSYLKKLSGLFPENPAAWIASYNAGEEAVGRWLKNGGPSDIEEWIEEIPYDETNLYVKKVLVSYWKYQRLYSGK